MTGLVLLRDRDGTRHASLPDVRPTFGYAPTWCPPHSERQVALDPFDDPIPASPTNVTCTECHRRLLETVETESEGNPRDEPAGPSGGAAAAVMIYHAAAAQRRRR